MKKTENLLVVIILISLMFCFPGKGQHIVFAGMQDTHERHDHGSMSHQNSSGSKDVNIILEKKPVNFMAGDPAVLLFSFKDGKGNPVKELTITHDRILHVVIISEDLSVFGHVHPEDSGPVTKEIINSAEFPVRYNFPKAGRYLVAADAAVKGKHVSKYFRIDVSGTPEMGKLNKDLSRIKRSGDYDITLTHLPEHITAGKEVTIRYDITKNGNPVTDMEPYLAAPMHIAMVLTDLSNFVHAHGVLPDTSSGHHPVGHIHGTFPDKFGPRIEANVVFPVQGIYQIFSEIKHNGKVIVMSFMIEVE